MEFPRLNTYFPICLVLFIPTYLRYSHLLRAISDEEGANRKRFPTVVYDGELVYILPNVKMTFKLAGDIDPANINVIRIDFMEFPRVNRCNRMSF